jgi:hypothetical protein
MAKSPGIRQGFLALIFTFYQLLQVLNPLQRSRNIDLDWIAVLGPLVQSG